MRTISYGPLQDQVGDLYLPDVGSAPVVCLLHGGFWRTAYGRDNIAPIGLDLRERGFAVWNLEYRRVGAAGGGWPATLQDVAMGIDHLATIAAGGAALDLGRITVVGHSAGGHLALWSAAQRGRVAVSAVVGLAPVADLALAYRLRCGNGAVENLMGGSPEEHPLRYRAASPAQMLPLGVRQLIIHGTHDEDVPVDISRRYVKAAAAAGDDVRYLELETAAHMDFVDPRSAASRWLFDELSSPSFSGRSASLHRR